MDNPISALNVQYLELKMKLFQLLLQTNELKTLENIEAQLKGTSKSDPNEIVAYFADGKPISLKEHKKIIVESIKQAKNEEVISLEDLEKEAENW